MSAHCSIISLFFFFNDTATTEIYTLSLHDALPISSIRATWRRKRTRCGAPKSLSKARRDVYRDSGKVRRRARPTQEPGILQKVGALRVPRSVLVRALLRGVRRHAARFRLRGEHTEHLLLSAADLSHGDRNDLRSHLRRHRSLGDRSEERRVGKE